MKYKVLIKIVEGTLHATDRWLHRLMKWSDWLNKAAGNEVVTMGKDMGCKVIDPKAKLKGTVLHCPRANEKGDREDVVNGDEQGESNVSKP